MLISVSALFPIRYVPRHKLGKTKFRMNILLKFFKLMEIEVDGYDG